MTDDQWIQLYKLLGEARSEYETTSEPGTPWRAFTDATRFAEGVLKRDFGWTDEEIEKGELDNQPRHGEE